MSTLGTIIWVVSFAIFVFFLIYTLTTFALIGYSIWQSLELKVERGQIFVPPARLRRPGISLVAPAYNMEALIVASTRSLLASDYEPLEVVIVDDGSADGTTDVLIRAFDLIELPVGDRLTVPTAPIENVYVSRTDRRLRVVRKENGGRSDALNAGLNIARQELVATIDADTLLEPDALKRVAERFAEDPDNVVAVGGTTRIANGALIEKGAVVEARVAKPGFQASQTAEYLRGFLGGRIAWSGMNGLLIISGAFGLFRRDLLRNSGGLSHETMGEDMEVVMRLHHQLRPHRPETRIVYAADATAWTEIPTSRRPLRTQRIRWHVGLFDNLHIHREMIMRRRFGAAGLWALPYTIAFEVIGPVLQAAGIVIVIVMFFLHLAAWQYVLAFFVISSLSGQLQTAGAIVIEEISFRRYRDRDLMLLGLWSLLEVFWYRPLTAIWRTWATKLVLTGRRPGWGTIPRGTAFKEEPDTDLAPAPLPR